MLDSLRYVESYCQRLVDYRSSAALRWGMTHPEEERQALGARLAELRKAHGFTLRALAQALKDKGYEIGFNALGHWETGKNVPDAIWMRRLARLYKIPVDAMYGDAEISVRQIELAAQFRDAVIGEMDIGRLPTLSSPAPSKERKRKKDDT